STNNEDRRRIGIKGHRNIRRVRVPTKGVQVTNIDDHLSGYLHLDPPEYLIGGGFVEAASTRLFTPQQDPSGIGKRKRLAIHTATHHRVAAQPEIARIKMGIGGFGQHEITAWR